MSPPSPPPSAHSPPSSAHTLHKLQQQQQQLLRSVPADRDAAVRATDDEAATCRLSASNAGLINDRWVQYFVEHAALKARRGEVRRSPIINKGTYLRTQAIDEVVRRFARNLPPGTTAQVLSLGAGCDTRHLRLISSSESELLENVIYFELDQADVVRKKSAMFRDLMASTEASTEFRSLKQYNNFTIDAAGSDARGRGYRLVSADLRSWEAAAKKLLDSGFDVSLPTLVISECALVYLDLEARNEILRWLRQNVSKSLAYIEYTIVHPDDAFGRMMVKNLRVRGIEMPSVESLRDPAAHVAQLREVLGFEHAEAVTASQYFARVLPADEKRRAMRIEPLDEVEEWELMLGHYALVYGAAGESQESQSQPKFQFQFQSQ